MPRGITDPTTGKTFVYKGLVPERRVADNCKHDQHSECYASPQELIKHFSFSYTKLICCLCRCHFEGI